MLAAHLHSKNVWKIGAPEEYQTILSQVQKKMLFYRIKWKLSFLLFPAFENFLFTLQFAENWAIQRWPIKHARVYGDKCVISRWKSFRFFNMRYLIVIILERKLTILLQILVGVSKNHFSCFLNCFTFYTCFASNLHWMIISLRRLHDLDRATPDGLEVLRERASKENEKMQTPGCGRELRVGSQVGSSSRGRTNSQSSQHSKTVLKMMIPIQQATDLNVIGGKLIESAEKEKLSIQHAFALENI